MSRRALADMSYWAQECGIAASPMQHDQLAVQETVVLR
jgi:hypothetical protein